MLSPCLHLSNLQTTKSLDLHLQRNAIGKQFSHFSRYHLLQKVFKLQVSSTSHQFINQDWRRSHLVLKTFPRNNLVDATWIICNSLHLHYINHETFHRLVWDSLNQKQERMSYKQTMLQTLAQAVIEAGKTAIIAVRKANTTRLAPSMPKRGCIRWVTFCLSLSYIS